MKKETRNVILAFVFSALTVGVVFFLINYNSTKNPVDSQHKKFGRKAVEIADAYLDFEISAQEAYKQISDLYSARSSMPKTPESDEYRSGNESVEMEVFLLSCDLSDAYFKNDSSDVLGSRNKLAETLGLSSR